ncbi:cilia- and flagella-associated protein 45 isoform X1 [Protopterus annectens]|uniref:cilia- and flagella-associated protein 45 isoform X1 n=2 Tax=Protopterus annectens TaxID=7888 RepID=UPI001CFC3531|nr:cilia- and flagella-associated protein 45 isoform X1 [Protopterus annectens]
MPASSSVSHSASTSSGSNHSRSRRYRTKALGSHVDETLFGSPNKKHDNERDNAVLYMEPEEERRRKTNSAPAKGQKPETIRIIMKDLIRNLIVPSEDPSGLSVIMSPSEFSRIKSASYYLTKKERESFEQAWKEQKEAIMEASNDRKNFMKQQEMKRRKNEKLTELEEEARQRAEYILQHANAMRMEQEDEIKQLNEAMLSSKCHAIRDAQILEKQQILKEMQEEEKRLDEMMEVERQRALVMQEQIEEMRKQERIRGKQQIIQQMQENEVERLLVQEQREQDARHMAELLDDLQLQELKHLQEKRQQQRELRQEINKINSEQQNRREMLKEQEKLADLKVLEYMKQKTEREAEYEAEQEKIRKEKEKEVARLRALQERARDHRAEQDALRAKRSQEAAERQWRKKEKEEAQKKAETEAMLKQARSEQVALKEHYLSVEAQRERNEFSRVLGAQIAEIEKEKKELEERMNLRQQHAYELRNQVREREQKHIQDRMAFFEEGKRLDEEAKQRRARLDEYKKKKLDELRAVGLPEKYCAHVERRINAQPALA